jgi:hypothetical protein
MGMPKSGVLKIQGQESNGFSLWGLVCRAYEFIILTAGYPGALALGGMPLLN